MIGPYQYTTEWLKERFYTSGEAATQRIQASIDRHVQEGWELFECHPIATASVWQWTILIFRRPHERTQ
ncbi:MAG TPA: hypothetical protein P5555_16815 [Candidatus Paceibacterota bacterium]|nr:hypothetical protein [Verrucomicrobiota bacterium]HRZ46841.1 hypothetical protein [Candidatus Paceibacterota bacterium]HRZ93314.1 hypothetical protein [Candidatus Paceibacterota bacterium]